MKTLDFYEHEINCSLKCQSRNYIKNRKAEGGNSEMNINSDNNSERFSEMCEINEWVGNLFRFIYSKNICIYIYWRLLKWIEKMTGKYSI